MKHEIIINGLEDLDRAAGQFLSEIGDSTLVAFFAPMGSGKTTFTTAICRVLGVTDPVGSPTFAIVNEYMRKDGEPMYHFDFYRITDGDDLYSIGYDDIIEEDGYTLGEWSENIVDFLPEDAIRVTISRLYTDENATAEQLMLRRIDVDYGELFE